MEKCKAKCETYSRVCGYFRPVANWNHGKREEFKERKMFKAKKVGLVGLIGLVGLFSGCASNVEKITSSATNKNLNLDGSLLWGAIETNNPETGTPEGKMIIGRLTYKSRKVGIPADQRVPTTGYFKRTKTKSFFGTEEEITEFDFTAGSDAEAAKAMEVMKGMKTAENKTELNRENGAAAAVGKTAK